MENPAKLLCQNKGRNMNDKTMKALANDILAKCQEQELSYAEMRTLIIMLSGRLESAQTALRDLPISVVGITPFDFGKSNVKIGGVHCRVERNVASKGVQSVSGGVFGERNPLCKLCGGKLHGQIVDELLSVSQNNHPLSCPDYSTAGRGGQQGA